MALLLDKHHTIKCRITTWVMNSSSMNIIGHRRRTRRSKLSSSYSYKSSPLLSNSNSSSNNNNNSIFPIHILGSGSIGLLYASAIHDTYSHHHPNPHPRNLLLWNANEEEDVKKNTTCQKINDEEGFVATQQQQQQQQQQQHYYPVTLLMRSHHKSRLILLPSSVSSSSSSSSSSSTSTTLISPPQWVAPVTIRRSNQNNSNTIIHQCNIPVELIDDCNSASSSRRSSSGHEDEDHGIHHPNDSNNNTRINNNNNNNNNPTIHTLVLATKANDAISALESIWDTRIMKSSSSSPTKIIILSNGALAIRDAIYKRFGGGGGGRYGRHDDSSTTSSRHDDDDKSKNTNNVLLEENQNNIELILGTTTHGAHPTTTTTTTTLRHDDDDDDDDESSSRRSRNNVGHNYYYYDITHAGMGCTTCTDLPFTQLCHSIGVGWDAECLSMLDMHVMLWKKLAVNCVINPLTAIYNVTNGQLLCMLLMRQRKEDCSELLLLLIMRQILQEVSIVATMEMKSLYNDAKILTSSGYNNTPHYDQSWLLSATEALSSFSLEKFVFQVMDSTKDNVSSMLQDMRSGKTTEIEFLNGYVASLGQQKYGLDCPRNSEMCHLVQQRKLEER